MGVGRGAEISPRVPAQGPPTQVGQPSELSGGPGWKEPPHYCPRSPPKGCGQQDGPEALLPGEGEGEGEAGGPRPPDNWTRALGTACAPPPQNSN